MTTTPTTPSAADRTATVRRATKETSIEVILDVDGTGATEVRPDCRSSTTWSASSAVTEDST